MIKEFFIWNLCVISFLYVSAVHADNNQLDDGIAAVEKQDYMTAYQVFKNLAEQGDREAQYNLAILYRQGKGVMQDPAMAATWFQKAADQGLPGAQYYMGHLYSEGEGVEKDLVKAFDWYKKAAEHGNPMAQSNLGVAYANGEGVKQDIVLAYVWFSLATSQGVTTALENRNVLKKDMSEQLVENAQRLTREYFNKYIAPYQTDESKVVKGNHPALGAGDHQHMHSPGAGVAPSAGHPSIGQGHP